MPNGTTACRTAQLPAQAFGTLPNWAEGSAQTRPEDLWGRKNSSLGAGNPFREEHLKTARISAGGCRHTILDGRQDAGAALTEPHQYGMRIWNGTPSSAGATSGRG